MLSTCCKEAQTQDLIQAMGSWGDFQGDGWAFSLLKNKQTIFFNSSLPVAKPCSLGSSKLLSFSHAPTADPSTNGVSLHLQNRSRRQALLSNPVVTLMEATTSCLVYYNILIFLTHLSFTFSQQQIDLSITQVKIITIIRANIYWVPDTIYIYII